MRIENAYAELILACAFMAGVNLILGNFVFQHYAIMMFAIIPIHAILCKATTLQDVHRIITHAYVLYLLLACWTVWMVAIELSLK